MQIDGVMMGSPLGALFANIFMCELENTVIPQLGDDVDSWTRYVDDTFAFIKPEKIEMVKRKLNEFHDNIKFTHELEKDETIPFLDILIRMTENREIETSVYRKVTNTDIYMNWYSHAPFSWKIATLKSLVKRAFLISSKPQFLNEELDHIKETFTKKNDYPISLVDEVIGNERNRNREQTSNETEEEQSEDTQNNDDEEKPVSLTLNLPYAGVKGEQLVKKVTRFVSQTVNKTRKKVVMQTVYRAKRLGSNFNIKDKIPFRHQHNVVYHSKCPNKKCRSHYGGETRCRIEKRSGQHGKDLSSHLFKHAQKTKHKKVDINSFKIIGKGYRSNFARKISESLFIKKLKPDLNVQKDSYKLSLFN